MTTPNLLLPEIAESQAAKYATHNEALHNLDALVQCSVIDKDLATPPGTPAQGDTYIVAATATGDWLGKEDQIAHYYGTAWDFYPPEEGWKTYVRDEDTTYRYNGTAWELDAPDLGNLQIVTNDILQTTNDASDNLWLGLGGGGALADTRGAYIQLYGNEYSPEFGVATISAGLNASDGYIEFLTQTTRRMTVTYDGPVMIDTRTDPSPVKIFSINHALQVVGTTQANTEILLGKFTNDAFPPRLRIAKSRGTTVGANVIVQDNDKLGEIDFHGSDGGDLNEQGAVIIAEVDGTPTTNVVPGALRFDTSNSSGVLVTGLYIDSSQNVYGTTGTTNMTDGFIFMPAAAGPPTGTPSVTTVTLAAAYYDTTNGAPYHYNHVANAWESLADRVRTYLTGDRLWSGNPALAIDTNFDVQTVNAVVVSIDGVLASVAAATCDTGAVATFALNTWGIFVVSSDSAGALTATWATNGGSGYVDEATAIAALPALPASEAPIGYVTVHASVGNTWTAGTDALAGGTGGNPAQTTNYYNLADPMSVI